MLNRVRFSKQTCEAYLVMLDAFHRREEPQWMFSQDLPESVKKLVLALLGTMTYDAVATTCGK